MAAIPNELEPAILMRLSDGLSHEEVAQWVQSRYGVEVSSASVRALAKRVLSLQSFAAKQAARRGAESTVRLCMDAMTENVTRLRKLATKYYEEIENPPFKNEKGEPIPVPPGQFLATVEQMRKLCDTALHYSGVDQPDGQGTIGELFADLIAEESSSLLARQPGRAGDRSHRLSRMG